MYVCAKDIHLDLLENARRILSEKTFSHYISEARRSFLKNISYEIRTPLNSFSIGIEILESSGDRKEGDLESLSLLKAASLFMQDNVLSRQNFEEGARLIAYIHTYI
jgi:signal transduction histidine kinase